MSLYSRIFESDERIQHLGRQSAESPGDDEARRKHARAMVRAGRSDELAKSHNAVRIKLHRPRWFDLARKHTVSSFDFEDQDDAKRFHDSISGVGHKTTIGSVSDNRQGGRKVDGRFPSLHRVRIEHPPEKDEADD